MMNTIVGFYYVAADKDPSKGPGCMLQSHTEHHCRVHGSYDQQSRVWLHIRRGMFCPPPHIGGAGVVRPQIQFVRIIFRQFSDALQLEDGLDVKVLKGLNIKQEMFVILPSKANASATLRLRFSKNPKKYFEK